MSTRVARLKWPLTTTWAEEKSADVNIGQIIGGASHSPLGTLARGSLRHIELSGRLCVKCPVTRCCGCVTAQ